MKNKSKKLINIEEYVLINVLINIYFILVQIMIIQ